MSRKKGSTGGIFVSRVESFERDHEGTHDLFRGNAAVNFYRGSLRHELRKHAGASLALRLLHGLGNHDLRRGRNALAILETRLDRESGKGEKGNGERVNGKRLGVNRQRQRVLARMFFLYPFPPYLLPLSPEASHGSRISYFVRFI